MHPNPEVFKDQFLNGLPPEIQPFIPFLVTASTIIAVAVALRFVLRMFLGGFGLMRIADKHNEPHSWMAFVPLLNRYILGKIAFQSTGLAILLPALVIAPLVVGLGALSGMVVLAASIMYYVALYKVYKKMSNHFVLMLVFSILTLGFLTPFFLFGIRNNELRIDGTNT